ncbi:MAG: phage holin family protein [Bacteroidales bacterium]|jgi:phosphoglycerol transferase MdoB-like AlkP superfamily enzyme|nr:phage holin family protein [Bacteroidales bacterium]
MEDYKGNNFEILLERSEDYIRTCIKLFKLNTINKILKVGSAIITKAVVTLFLFMFLFIASIGGSILLGETLGRLWYGFAIVAAFYGIVAIVIALFLNNWFKRMVSNFILKQIVKIEPDEKY